MYAECVQTAEREKERERERERERETWRMGGGIPIFKEIHKELQVNKTSLCLLSLCLHLFFRKKQLFKYLHPSIFLLLQFKNYNSIV